MLPCPVADAGTVGGPMTCEVRLELAPDRPEWEAVRRGCGRSRGGERESVLISGDMTEGEPEIYVYKSTC